MGLQAQKYGEDDLRDVLTARFVMVSMEPDGKKTVPNVALRLETDEDKAWFQVGFPSILSQQIH